MIYLDEEEHHLDARSHGYTARIAELRSTPYDWDDSGPRLAHPAATDAAERFLARIDPDGYGWSVYATREGGIWCESSDVLGEMAMTFDFEPGGIVCGTWMDLATGEFVEVDLVED